VLDRVDSSLDRAQGQLDDAITQAKYRIQGSLGSGFIFN